MRLLRTSCQLTDTKGVWHFRWVTSDFTPEIIQDPLLKGRRGKMWETSWETLGVNPGMKLSSESGGPTGPRRQTVSVNGLKGTAEELKPWGV